MNCYPCNQNCQQGRTCPARQATTDKPASGQTRISSMTETVVGVVIGFMVSLTLIHFVLPMYGHHTSTSENVQITAIFTVASILRGYFVRRFFNNLQGR